MTDETDPGTPGPQDVPGDRAEAEPENLPAVPDREVFDTHCEAALDDPPPPVPVPGAQPVYVDLIEPREERLPVIPDSLAGLANIKRSAVRVGGRYWHTTRYHGLRSPVYLLAALAWAAAGVFRLAGRQLHWWWLLEQHEMRSLAAAVGDSREWLKLHKEAKQTRHTRGIILVGEAVVIAVAAVQYLTWLGWVLLGAVALPVLPASAARPAAGSSAPRS